jgi:hypothetical protein
MRLTPPYLQSFNVQHAQLKPRIKSSPFPLTRPLGLWVVRRPKSHLLIINLLNDDSGLLEPEFVDFSAYRKFIFCPPLVVDRRHNVLP